MGQIPHSIERISSYVCFCAALGFIFSVLAKPPGMNRATR